MSAPPRTEEPLTLTLFPAYRGEGTRVDILVIGAGPAGSLAAFLLARAGRRVVLVEQNRFPRNKVCGECLSTLGIGTLRRAGLAERVHALSPAILTGTSLYSTDGASSFLPIDGEIWGVSRLALDPLLLDAARDAGAEVLQPARVERISPTVVVRDLETNELREVQAAHVIVADGKGALLPRRPQATSDFGVKTHFEGVEADPHTIGLYGLGEGYGGVAPIEGNRWNAAFSVPAARLQACRGRLDELFAEWRGRNLALDAHFRDARRVGEWCASPLPRFAVAGDWPRGVIPIGNAAAALEPIGGEGMGLALRSAELAAEALLAADAPDVDLLRKRFDELWRVRRFACRAAALALSSPIFARPAVDLLGFNETLAGAALHLMGKGAAREFA